MKESWMNKLIELLNEYNKEIWKPKRMSEREVRTHYSWVICSWYWFIKWLVENDKIDRWKIEEKISGDVSLYLDNREYYWRYKWLLMLLAISENPISDLISYLK